MLRTLVVCIALLHGGLSLATTPIPVTVDELATRAETIVVGTVERQAARFNDARTAIVTDTVLTVEETIAGESASTLTVTEYGGCVGKTCMGTSGKVEYEIGERVLLFVCRDALDLPRTCGATQGRLRVRTLDDGATVATGVVAGEPVKQALDALRRRILEARP